MKMSNEGNRWIYRLWAPFYDRLAGRAFAVARRRAVARLALRPGERVLLLGVGTGADLPLLPEGVSVTGVDLSPEMLARAREKLPLPGREVTLLEGDAQRPDVPPESFDAALLTLILSVVPDGGACLRAALRALKPGGRVVVFDKFVAEGASPSILRRGVNLVTSAFGTDITRRFGDLAAGAECRVVHEEPGPWGDPWRLLVLEKTSADR